MARARFLTASRIAGNAETRDSHIPRMNYKPAFESILRTGDISSAPEKLSSAFKSLMAAAAKNGVGREIGSILKTYASEIGNDIVLLTLRRLERLVENTPKDQLKDRLAMCSTLMKEFQDAADAVPAILTGNDRITSNGRLCLDSMRKVLKRGIGKSKSLCPKEISKTITAEYESGRLDDIQGVFEMRKEQARADKNPVAAITPASIQPAPAQQPVPVSVIAAAFQSGAQSPIETILRTHAHSPLSPLQIWDEDRKLRDGSRRQSREPLITSRDRGDFADRRIMEPEKAFTPTRPLSVSVVSPTSVRPISAQQNPATHPAIAGQPRSKEKTASAPKPAEDITKAKAPEPKTEETPKTHPARAPYNTSPKQQNPESAPKERQSAKASIPSPGEAHSTAPKQKAKKKPGPATKTEPRKKQNPEPVPAKKRAHKKASLRKTALEKKAKTAKKPIMKNRAAKKKKPTAKPKAGSGNKAKTRAKPAPRTSANEAKEARAKPPRAKSRKKRAASETVRKASRPRKRAQPKSAKSKAGKSAKPRARKTANSKTRKTTASSTGKKPIAAIAPFKPGKRKRRHRRHNHF